ncbi:hypothetical protein [Caudoviricetes sp.]|nr:hypothetical protein [Caudoviricetes sp.]
MIFFIPGFKDMKTSTKIVSTLAIYGFIPVALSSHDYKTLFLAIQILSLIIMFLLSITDQYWKEDKHDD